MSNSASATPDRLKHIEEREVEILRAAVDKLESRAGKKVAQAPEVQKIINRLERFLQEKKLVCYGGTAINAMLPEKYRFYNNDIEVPDYDFYSPDALEHAKELADIFFKMGYNEVEAKSGTHPGTFKVFVNFMPIADITFMDRNLFDVLSSQSYIKNGIRYAPTNFLRMAMYLELSRPEGDVSRWEKVLKRLTLLNKVYPMELGSCSKMELQRPIDDDDDIDMASASGDESDTDINNSSLSKKRQKLLEEKRKLKRKQTQDKIYELTQNVLMNSDLVFIGGFADILYTKYLPKNEQRKLTKNPEFDVLSNKPYELAKLIKLTLNTNGIHGVTVEKMPAIGEIVLDHYKVAVGNNIIVLIYKPTACHSYNAVKLNGKLIKVASIDTMLMFYLIFSYAKRYYYNRERLLCLASILFYIQNKNRLSQSGLLKRFGSSCYGRQETLETMRRERAMKFEELKTDKHNPEYEHLFLRYVPIERVKTRVKNLRKKQSHHRRKKLSMENRLLESAGILDDTIVEADPVSVRISPSRTKTRRLSSKIKSKSMPKSKSRRVSKISPKSKSTSTSTSRGSKSASILKTKTS
jgi:hypothetical protein